MRNIGDVIRQYRLKNNLTQDDLGKMMFVSKQAVSKWENGKTLPDIETIRKLAEALSIPHEEILGEAILQTKKYKKWIKVLIPFVVVSMIVALFFAFDGVGIIKRHFQSGTVVLTLYESGDLTDANNYKINGLSSIKAGKNGYSFKGGYGELKGTLITEEGQEIEFGFINTNNWHNIQIIIRIDTLSGQKIVSQTVIYKTDGDRVSVIESESAAYGNEKVSVFKDGV